MTQQTYSVEDLQEMLEAHKKQGELGSVWPYLYTAAPAIAQQLIDVMMQQKQDAIKLMELNFSTAKEQQVSYDLVEDVLTRREKYLKAELEAIKAENDKLKKNSCPHVVSSDEGTSYCKLDEESMQNSFREIKALKSQVGVAVKCLEFYGSAETWETLLVHRSNLMITTYTKANHDYGKLARESLSQLQKEGE